MPRLPKRESTSRRKTKKIRGQHMPMMATCMLKCKTKKGMVVSGSTSHMKEERSSKTTIIMMGSWSIASKTFRIGSCIHASFTPRRYLIMMSLVDRIQRVILRNLLISCNRISLR
jgi:hypothetical protein